MFTIAGGIVLAVGFLAVTGFALCIAANAYFRRSISSAQGAVSKAAQRARETRFLKIVLGAGCAYAVLGLMMALLLHRR